MRIPLKAFAGLGLSVFLSGCLAATAVDTAVDVVTLPVKVVSKGVDLATESQSERDEKLGRELRKRTERLGKLERELKKQQEKCAKGSRKACDNAQDIYDEIQELLPTIPYAPRYPS